MPEIIDRRISFNNGEVSPWLDPRIDLDKYRSSCKSLRNMLPTPYGGAFRRPGTIPIGFTHNDNRALLRPFPAGNGTTWMLEFTDEMLRIWTTGATPALVESGGSTLEIATPYPTADLRSLQFTQLNDLLFIAHRDHAPRVLARYSDTVWRLQPYVADWPATQEKNGTDITIGTGVSAPSSPSPWSSSTTYAAGDRCTQTLPDGINYTFASRYDNNKGFSPSTYYRHSGVWWNRYKLWWRSLGPTIDVATTPTYSVGKRIVITSSDALFSSSMKGQKWAIDFDQPSLSHTINIPAAAVNDTSSSLFVIGAWSAALTATTSGTAPWAAAVSVQRSYDFIEWETIAEMQANDTDVQQLIAGSETKPTLIRLVLTAKSGTLPSNYTARINTKNAKWRGMVLLTEYLTTTTFRCIVEFPFPSTASNTTEWYEDAFGGRNGWPQSICIHEGRLWFAGTEARPTTLWSSRIDDFGDFRLATEEDAAQSYTLASGKSSRIRWMASMDDLCIGTAFDEWILSRRGNTDTLRARRQSAIGSDRRPPVLAGDSILYIQGNQRKIREFSWDAERSSYSSQDISMLSEHLGDALFVEAAGQSNPYTTVWIVTENGKLRTVLYDRQQNIVGWAQHDIGGGTAKSVAIAPAFTAGDDDEVWLNVTRTIDGSTKSFIERINPNGFSSIKDATQMEDWLVYVDCSVQGVLAAGSVTGPALATLEGEDVEVLHNGIHLGTFPISSGAISGISDVTLAGPVTLGLPYTSTLEPTFMEFDDARSPSKAGKKRLTRAILELYKSRGAQITGNEARSYVNINDDLLSTERSLFTGLIEEFIQADTERQTTPRLRQSKPFPLNVLSITSRYQFEND